MRLGRWRMKIWIDIGELPRINMTLENSIPMKIIIFIITLVSMITITTTSLTNQILKKMIFFNKNISRDLLKRQSTHSQLIKMAWRTISANSMSSNSIKSKSVYHKKNVFLHLKLWRNLLLLHLIFPSPFTIFNTALTILQISMRGIVKFECKKK